MGTILKQALWSKKHMTHLFWWKKRLSFPPGTLHWCCYSCFHVAFAGPLLLLCLYACWNSSAAFVVRLRCMQGKMLEQQSRGIANCVTQPGAPRGIQPERLERPFMYLAWQRECRKAFLQEEAPSSFRPNTDFTYRLVLNQAQQAQQNSSQSLKERCLNYYIYYGFSR